jgi:hypothetical protein
LKKNPSGDAKLKKRDKIAALKEDNPALETPAAKLKLAAMSEEKRAAFLTLQQFVLENGATLVDCQRCHGNELEKCKSCEGKGYRPCTVCKGSERTCRSCDGTGLISNVSCQHCNGTGKLVCYFCTGKKTTLCDLCGGIGFANCVQCHGTGKELEDSQDDDSSDSLNIIRN